MSVWEMVWTIAVIVAAIGPMLAAMASATTAGPRTGTNAESTAAPYQAVLPLIVSHSAPERALTLPEAWHEVGLHRTCNRDNCPRKSAAYQVLVVAGKIRPARKTWL
jgi:hypothetical protein